jgi:GTP-binding protein
VAELREAGQTVVVSGLTGEGIEALAEELAALVVRGARLPAREAHVVLRPGRESFSVRQGGGRFLVEGPVVERWVAETDFEDERSVARLQDRLRREGVERRLAEIGARRGDEVVIGSQAFEFFPEEI